MQAVLIPTRPRAALMAQCSCCGTVVPSLSANSPLHWDESSVSVSGSGSETSWRVDRSADAERDGKGLCEEEWCEGESASMGGSLLAQTNQSPCPRAAVCQSPRALAASTSSSTPPASVYSPSTPRTPPPQEPASSSNSRIRRVWKA